MRLKPYAPTVACAASASLDALTAAADYLRGLDTTRNPYLTLAVRRSVMEIMHAHDGVCAILNASSKAGGEA